MSIYAHTNRLLGLGDCGSWVIDSNTGDWLGHVVAQNDDDLTGYIIPAVDIEARLGNTISLASSPRASPLDSTIFGHGSARRKLLEEEDHVDTVKEPPAAGSHLDVQANDSKMRLLNSGDLKLLRAPKSANNKLYEASERGNEKLVQLLLEKGADVNVRRGSYGTA